MDCSNSLATGLMVAILRSSLVRRMLKLEIPIDLVNPASTSWGQRDSFGKVLRQLTFSMAFQVGVTSSDKGTSSLALPSEFRTTWSQVGQTPSGASTWKLIWLSARVSQQSRASN